MRPHLTLPHQATQSVPSRLRNLLRGAAPPLIIFLGVLGGTARASVPPPQQIAADFQYGQVDFTTLRYDIPSNQRIEMSKGLAVTPEGLYVADNHLCRILFFPTNSSVATRVYGQPSFDTFTANTGGVSATSLANPVGLAADASGLYVADTYNNRVLHYPAGSTVADRVYGQPDFVSNRPNNGGVTARSLSLPNYVEPDPDGGLYISDTGNYRVLYYPPGSTEAAFVYGQPDFSTFVPGVSATSLQTPCGVAYDGNGIYVVDCVPNRVLYFPKGSKSATRVYGQPDFTSSEPNYHGIGPHAIQRPYDCEVDENGLYVAEYLNSRISFFPNGSTLASVVYGQPDFTSLGLNQYGISRYGFYVPWSVAVDKDHVYASDFTGRILRFPKVLNPMPASIAFQVQPPAVQAGTAFSEQPTVVVRRSDGSVATDYNGPVTVWLYAGFDPPRASLLGTTSVTAKDGVAVFGDLSVDAPGTYQLRAVAADLPVVESAEFTVSAPAGTRPPGDLDGNGAFNLADITKHLRIIAGLDTLTGGTQQ